MHLRVACTQYWQYDGQVFLFSRCLKYNFAIIGDDPTRERELAGPAAAARTQRRGRGPALAESEFELESGVPTFLQTTIIFAQLCESVSGKNTRGKCVAQ